MRKVKKESNSIAVEGCAWQGKLTRMVLAMGMMLFLYGILKLYVFPKDLVVNMNL